MRLTNVLSSLDDRVIRRRKQPPASDAADPTADQRDSTSRRAAADSRRPSGDAGRKVLGVVWRIARLVFLLLAVVVVLGVVFTLAPTNPDNVIVRNALELAAKAAGPFRDVFTNADPKRQLTFNYAVAAAVYLLAASLVRRLPTGKKG